jgi:hypothetical protein
MIKFVAPVCMALGLMAFSSAPVQALPVTSCFANGTFDRPGGTILDSNELLTCDLVEATSGEEFSVADPFSPNDWFTPSYAILLDAAGGASDVVEFHKVQGVDTVTLYSDGSANFASALALALGAPANALIRVVEAPAGSATTFFVNFQANVVGAQSAFVGCLGAANCDTINVYSDDGNNPPPPPPDGQVPEPATLTLMAVGGAVAAIRRRRKATV